MFKRTQNIYLLLAIASIALAASLLLTLNFLSAEIQKQQAQFKENLTWHASQLEREGLQFVQQLTLFEHGDSQANGESILEAFDIFWSRANTLQSGEIGAVVAEIPESDQLFDAVQAVLAACDGRVLALSEGVFDPSVPICREFETLLGPIHNFVQSASSTELQIREAERNRFLDIKKHAVWLLFAGFCSGGLLAYLLLTRQRSLNRLYHYLEQQVEARTEELSQANLALKTEVARHRDARGEMLGLRKLLEDILNLMPSVLVGVNGQAMVMQWNQQAEAVTGIAAEQAIGAPIDKVLPGLAQWLYASKARLCMGETVNEHRSVCPVGRTGTLVDIAAYPLAAGCGDGVVVRIDDVTERVRIEELMIQSEKMISIGNLAAGMAHEINNPLAGIVQNLQVIERRLSSDLEANQRAAEECGISLEKLNLYLEKRKLLKMFAMIHESTDRAVKIVRNMLSFSHDNQEEFSHCSLTTLLDYAVELANGDFDLSKSFDFKKIHLVREYEKQLPEVECQASQLQQVFLSILKNAAQAMSENPLAGVEPQIVLRANQVDGWVCVEIQDNGPGMDENVCKRVFEPFYTNREVGSGTGLGLSVAYKIISKNHGGNLELISSPGQGSHFLISIPCQQAKSQRVDGSVSN